MDLASIATLQQTAGTSPTELTIHVQAASLASKTSRTGNPYLEAKLADGSGHLTLRAWSDGPLFDQLQPFHSGAFLQLSGTWIQKPPYGIEPVNLQVTALKKDEIDALLQGPSDLREKQANDLSDITEFAQSLQDPRLRGLCLLFLEEFGDRLKRSAGARTYHHARRGGLIEHCAQMMRSASALCTVYLTLNRDLLLAGVLFHDCGKLWENVYAENDFTMPYNELGELLGHIPLGMEVVNKLWRLLLDSPEAKTWKDLTPSNDQVRLHLLHLVGSHHGEYQFGAPVLPKTPEAVALHYIDNLDAKLEMVFDGYAKGAPLSKSIIERVRPLPANLVKPLERFGEG